MLKRYGWHFSGSGISRDLGEDADGDYIEVEDLAEAVGVTGWWPTVSFDPNTIPKVIEAAERLLDEPTSAVRLGNLEEALKAMRGGE